MESFWQQKEGRKMVTVNMPEKKVVFLDTLVDQGWYMSRSEIIRNL